MDSLSVICEITMIVLFGASWPFNIVRAYKSKTTKGTSLVFLFLIEIGYTVGILSKLFAYISSGVSYWTTLRIIAFTAYIINFIMLFIAIIIYFRNRKIDESRTLSDERTTK